MWYYEVEMKYFISYHRSDYQFNLEIIIMKMYLIMDHLRYCINFWLVSNEIIHFWHEGGDNDSIIEAFYFVYPVHIFEKKINNVC